MMTASEPPSSGEVHVSGYSAATEAHKVWRSYISIDGLVVRTTIPQNSKKT
eukprot:COSAG02_NODE_1838_length_10711_cov_222.198643_6_plen_51_part_00